MKKSRLLSYAASVVIVSLATLVQRYAWTQIEPAPFLLFYPAVVLAAAFGDGVVAVLLSTIAVQLFFTHPEAVGFHFDPHTDGLRLLIFAVSALGLATLTKAFRNATHRAKVATSLLTKQLAESNAIFESLYEGVIVGDAHGFRRANSEALRLYGVSSAEELFKEMGQNGRVVQRDPETGDILSFDRLPFGLALKGEAVVRESLLHNMRGEDLYTRCAGAPIKVGGHVVGGVTICSDITVYKRVEGERERFVSTLTHDLRNPLTAAKTTAQLLVRRFAYNDIIRSSSERIVQSINRADKMIQDMLDASRIRAGEPLPLKLEPCDLRPLVRDVIDEFRVTHGDRFVFHADEAEPLTGRWSCMGLRRVIENLVSNAVKYGAADTPITIRAQVRDENVRFEVNNKGTPINPSELSEVFEPFRRSAHAEKSGKKGWGLGLTLVRGLVQAHHGSVAVESSPHDGTTFTVTLPRDTQAAAAKVA